MNSATKKEIYNHLHVYSYPRKRNDTLREKRRLKHSPLRFKSPDKFVSSRPTFFEYSRMFQFIWFLGCLSGFSFQVYTYLSLYYKYPVRLDMNRHPDYTQLIPTITVCNYNPVKVKVACQTKTEFCSNGTITDMANYASILVNSTTEEIFSFGYSFKDMIQCTPKSYCEFFFYSYGNCYSINSNYTGETKKIPTAYKKFELLKIKINFGSSEYPVFLDEYGALLALHGATNMPDSYGGFTIESGYNYEAVITKRVYKFLQKPYIPNCLQYDKLNIAGNGYKVLSRELCMGHCIYWTTMRNFGCYSINRTEPIMPSYLEDKCSTPNQIFGEADDIGNYCLPDCSVDCVEQDYEVELRMKVHRDEQDLKRLNKTWLQAKLNGLLDSEVKFSYKSPMVQVFEYQPVYQSIEVFGNLGGYMGMWLGASLLSFGNYVHLIWTHFKNRRRLNKDYSFKIVKTKHFCV